MRCRYLSPAQFEDRMYLIEEEYRDHELEDGETDKDEEKDVLKDEEDVEKKERTDPFHHEPADVVVGTVKIPLDGIECV